MPFNPFSVAFIYRKPRHLKKLVSIVFLIIFLFNVGGYYLVFWGLKFNAKKELLTRLDTDDYSSDDITVITFPLSMPYPIFQHDYERIDKEFEFKGEYFRTVKQKLENDTLFVVCIKDVRKKSLTLALTDYSKLVNDLPIQSKQALNFPGKLGKDFCWSEILSVSAGTGWSFELSWPNLSSDLINEDYPVTSPPPENKS